MMRSSLVKIVRLTLQQRSQLSPYIHARQCALGFDLALAHMLVCMPCLVGKNSYVN
jgi:hypothetical protein